MVGEKLVFAFAALNLVFLFAEIAMNVLRAAFFG
jgi:hypothetical protein